MGRKQNKFSRNLAKKVQDTVIQYAEIKQSIRKSLKSFGAKIKRDKAKGNEGCSVCGNKDSGSFCMEKGIIYCSRCYKLKK